MAQASAIRNAGNTPARHVARVEHQEELEQQFLSQPSEDQLEQVKSIKLSATEERQKIQQRTDYLQKVDDLLMHLKVQILPNSPDGCTLQMLLVVVQEELSSRQTEI